MSQSYASKRGRRTAALLCGAVLILVVAGAVWAQFPGDMGKFGRGGFDGFDNTAVEFLQSYDADGDGQINRAEFLKAYETMFQIMDVSGDGKLDPEEVKRDPARIYADRSRWAAMVIERYDLNDDAKLSAEEAPFGAMAFERADVNKDKLMDRRELTQFSFDLALLSDTLRMADSPVRITQAFLKKYDKNRDGRLDKDEFEWGPELFAQIDRNGDGFLDSDEIPRLQGLPPSPKAQARDLIRQRDKDANGVLSLQEFGDTPDRFHQADANGDGQLTVDEIAATILAQQTGKGRMNAGGKRLDGPVPPGPAMPKPGAIQPPPFPPMPGGMPKPGAAVPPGQPVPPPPVAP